MKGEIVFNFHNNWEQLRGGFNWYTFTLINIEFENEKWLHGYEFRVVILGLGGSIRYNTEEALKLFDKWDKETKDELRNKKENTSKTTRALADSLLSEEDAEETS